MKIADMAIRNRVVTLVLTVVTIGAGLMAFGGLSRLEDPEFTIKQALVVTNYPGATAEEVEEEVTDRIEQAVQQLGQLKRIRESRSERGKSTVTVEIKDKYDKNGLPQVWDELRRKIGDAQQSLPPGAGPSMVIDDFGDVWGIFVVLYGDEYSYAELKEYGKFLRREFTLVKDVAKVQLFAEQQEVIYVEPDRDRMSQLGIPPWVITEELKAKNLVADSGRVEVGRELISIDPTGGLETVEQFESILLTASGSSQIYLRDVADVRRGYQQPSPKFIRYDGKQGIGIGISTVSGGNVVEMGEAVLARWQELSARKPAGIDVGLVSVQSSAVVAAIDNFVVSLAQAVVIVVVVLLLFMGLRSGLLIGFILFLTICGTFIFMGPWNVALERISLGALIIALGMLVDNAIVIVDGMLVRLGKGEDAESAAKAVVASNAMPLLGATVVAVLAFASIGTSQDSTGEFCRSLFQVVFLSLMLSWVTAVTVTPLLGILFLKPSGSSDDVNRDPYAGGFYQVYKAALVFCMRFRYGVIGVVVALFAVSLVAFGSVDRTFFPNSTRPQFMLDYWLPQGTRIEDTASDVAKIETYLQELEHVVGVTSIVGGGGMRFLVTYSAEKDNPSYAQFFVDVDDYELIDQLIPQIEADLARDYPDSLVASKKFRLGPGEGGSIQFRVTGDGISEIRRLAGEVEALMHADGGAKAIRNSFREKVKSVVPVISEEIANLNGVTRTQLADQLKIGFEGLGVGVYRERDELLPIVVRAREEQRSDVASIANLQIWSEAGQGFIPVRQVVSSFETVYEDTIIMRRDRKRTVTVHCDPSEGSANALLARLLPKIEAIGLPPGYKIEIGGEYEDGRNAQAGLAATIPMFVMAMVLVVIMLFNSLRQPLIIWLCVPLALIGVSWGLLLTSQPFGFMALLGFLSLAGMLIKNAIVLIEEMDSQIREGKEKGLAILDASSSRLRPVAMAAITTVLGMVPLLPDAFFVAMAVTIMAGLSFATILTMVVVPTLYATFFGIDTPSSPKG